MRFKRLLLAIAILFYLKGLMWAIYFDYGSRPTTLNLLGIILIAACSVVAFAAIVWMIVSLCVGDYDEWIDNNIEPIFDNINKFFNRRNEN